MARPSAAEMLARVRDQQQRGSADDREVPSTVTSLPVREAPVEAPVPTAAPIEAASVPEERGLVQQEREASEAPASSAPVVAPTQRRTTTTPVTTRRGTSGAAAVTVVADFVDPRGWIPITPGSQGYAKKAPMINADLIQALEARKNQVYRATRRKVSWDQVMALAVEQLPKARDFVRELGERRGPLGLDDPAVPRRRVSGLVPYATADLVEDLAKEAEQMLGRRVSLEDVWAVAFSLVLDAINRGTGG